MHRSTQKIRVSLFALSLLLASVPFVASADINTGLVGHWAMDEGAGSAVADSSGNNHTGTMHSGTAWVAGKMLNGLGLDGINDVANLGNSTDLAGSSGVTVSAWIKPNSGDGDIMTRRDMSQSNMSWELLLEGGKLKFTNSVGAGSNADYDVISTANIDTSGSVWTHVIGSYNNSDGSIRVYINGVEDTNEVTGGGNINTPAGIDTIIGVHTDGAGLPVNFYSGSIDDARVYNRALSPGDVSDLYAYTGFPLTGAGSGLVGYYKFEENSGSTVADSSSNSNTGYLTNGTTWAAGKLGNGSASFDGVDDYVAVASSATTNFSAMTIAMWIKFADVVSVHRFFDREGENPIIRVTSGNLQFISDVFTNGSAVLADQWYHVTVVGSGAGHFIYLNGALDASNSSPHTGTSGVLSIGGSVDYFNGAIDEFRVYNRALTASEISSVYSYVDIVAPTVVTSSATSLGQTTATLNGSISSTGGSNATVRGFQHGLNISYGATTTESGSFSTGSFNSAISGLTCNTFYHFRAYATNSAGTSYGSDDSFTTSACDVVVEETPVVTSGATHRTGGTSRRNTYVQQIQTGVITQSPMSTPMVTTSIPLDLPIYIIIDSPISNTISTPSAETVSKTGNTSGATRDKTISLPKPKVYVYEESTIPKPFLLPESIKPKIQKDETIIRSNDTNFPLRALPPSGKFTETLGPGSKGDEVKALQTFLAFYPVYPVDLYPESAVTGIYDKATEKAVGRFQELFKIRTLNDLGYGYTGKATRDTINGILKAK